jgi:predicted nucleic acid-binding protein
MHTVYWDTSACLKLYVHEPDSLHYRRLILHNSGKIAISFLNRLEIHYALLTKERRGDLASGAATELFNLFEKDIHLGRFWVIPWGEDIGRQATRVADFCLNRPDPIFLRTLDGIHLGAIRAAGICQLVTSDHRMEIAATAIGLECIKP